MEIIRFKQLKDLLKISRSTIDRWEKKENFPKRIKLGDNSVGWLKEEVGQWIAKKWKEEG